MKKLKYLKSFAILFFLLIIFPACTDYLSDAPEADISKQDVFGEVDSYQGFIDDIYQGVVDPTMGRWGLFNWNFGDDLHSNHGWTLTTTFDNGNSWHWTNWMMSFFDANGSPENANKGRNTRGYWDGGWKNIRNANIALENLELLNASQEEKNIIAGQAYFFRGYFHFEILRSWGGMPYIDEVITPADKLNFPRMSYLETAEKISEDLREAAKLLPNDWDQTSIGQLSSGQNKGRLTKGAAWGFLGKNLLYAASPLINGEANGSYTYNEELAKQAAEAFVEVFKLEDQGYFNLVPWDQYSDNFYKIDGTAPLTDETVFNNPIYSHKRSSRGDFLLNGLGGWSCFAGPTQNYVEYFGMANGLPIDDPNSGFDENDPWSNRDPRFYYNIEVDGDRLVQTREVADTWAQYYIGGRHRDKHNGKSTTGYGYKKFKHPTINSKDRGWRSWYYEVPTMRLADVYLMYAEAVNEAYGPMGSAPGGPTAIEAVNKVRNRANVPDVPAQYTGDKETFREFIRKERAVELAFESHRWFDLRRWYVAHLPQYTEKYALEFDKDYTFFRKVLLVDRIFEEKHYWLPLPLDNVTLYEEFNQNSGW
jgi:starch-binding outer membrane protein, SusD/RagB family